MSFTGIGGLIILIADIYAIVMILQSSAKGIEKLIWFLVVFLLPLIGLIVWYFAGPGKKPFWSTELIRATLAAHCLPGTGRMGMTGSGVRRIDSSRIMHTVHPSNEVAGGAMYPHAVAKNNIRICYINRCVPMIRRGCLNGDRSRVTWSAVQPGIEDWRLSAR